ncbi:hypothetical protein [Actinacidiphila glaucinigra]|uniref:hypothetical protein n=1 Tax=Actinacidiphila glaucinigra TaxID=235986 RepID=UPI00366AB857
MQRSGPLHTLLAGLVLALIMLSLNATTEPPAADAKGGAPPSPAAPSAPPSSAPPAPRSPAPSPTATAAAPRPDADYAGRTGDGAASVAIALRDDGKAVAYVCDGRAKEAWLRGDVGDDGGMRLTGDRGARLEGTLEGGRVTGEVRLTGLEQPFTARRAVKPSGLYRAAASVRGARVVGGWIVLPNGKQVGIVSRDGEPSAAPAIDPATGAVTVDGTQLTARPIP